MLLADGSTRSRTVRFGRHTVIGASVAVFIVVTLVTIGASRLIAGYMTRQAMASVVDENRNLQRQIGTLSQRFTQVQDHISTLARRDDALRLLADMPPLDSDVREVGVGGAVAPNSGIGSGNPEFAYPMVDIDKLEREIQLQEQSYAQIEDRIKDRLDLFNHTPSIRPMDKGYYTSSFGVRKDPLNGRRAMHNGLDISVERGTPVMATADGTVVFAKATPGLGKLVVIDHGYGFRTAYGHLSVINVSKGQSIKRGQKVALSGATGRSTGPHLHYEVHVNDRPVDPRDFFMDGSDDVYSLK